MTNASFLIRSLRLVLAVMALATASAANAQSHPSETWEEDVQNPSPSGQKIFASNCAACHGLDGRGGKTAPSIARNARLQRLSNAEIAAIVSNGIPGTGMPAFHSLSPARVHAVVSYVRFLQGPNSAQKLPGDPSRGKAIFFDQGECSSCHAIHGEGKFTGPDLTLYGATHSAKEIRDAIAHLSSGNRHKIVTVITRDGQRFHGLILNEDNFSLQLQDGDGTFHFFSKSDLQKVEEEASTMPPDFSKRLNAAEVNDVISYLIASGRVDKPAATSKP